jgi:hypothetical protein
MNPARKTAMRLACFIESIDGAKPDLTGTTYQENRDGLLRSLCAGSLFCSDEAAAADFQHFGSEIGRKKTSSTRLFGLWRPIPGLQRHYAPSRTNRLRC